MLPLPFFVLLFFSDFLINLQYAYAQCRQDQKDLLLELKNNVSYVSWSSTKLVQWSDETSDCCKWAGVKCNDKGYVFSLDLSDELISGGIDEPSSLFGLVNLRNLSLALNSFDSSELPLPHGFGKLTALEYLNLSSSGFSGQIPSDISNLNRLKVLYLSSSSSYPPLKLENPDLERFIHNFTLLRELYLDGVNISATGHNWYSVVSSLSSLNVLSLSNAYITGPLDPSLLKLRSLQILRLSGNDFSSHFPQFLTDFPDLRVLAMSGCNLSGVSPGKLFEIPSLETVDLSNNRELEGTLPEFPLNGSLQDLRLSNTMFSGNVPMSITNLKMLSVLDLQNCNLSGPIPNSIKRLAHLRSLDLSFNRFTGSVPSFASMKNLRELNLASNYLTGQIPDTLWEGLESFGLLDLRQNLLQGDVPSSLFTLPSLSVLDLSNNRFSGSLREVSIGTTSIQTLDLSGNSLEGPIPRFLFELRNLTSLSLAQNKFVGSMWPTDFTLTELASLDLSNNNFSAHTSENVSAARLFPRLNYLNLSSCNLREFPLLKNHSSLMTLDLSENLLQGEVPNWIWEIGGEFLRYLNLSYNQLAHLQEPYNFRSLHFLDLRSNLLSGPIPVSPSAAAYLDFSNNNLSSSLPSNVIDLLTRAYFFSVADNKLDGTIPASLCNATNLKVLDLSNNSFNGGIPSCLCEKSFMALDLKRNYLTGDILDRFPADCSLKYLDLSYNALAGDAPESLGRCKDLEVLNVGNNGLDGTFPCWLRNLSNLHVFVLRSNRFHGNISCLGESLSMPRLQIIDLSSNRFDGALPENLFPGLKTMVIADKSGTQSQQRGHLGAAYFTAYRVYYQPSVEVIIKGNEFELGKINVIFTSLDFSDNQFNGSIPDDIGELRSLYLLNFSRNALSGQIPLSIGNMTTLGSLDLSFNGIGGKIPDQIVSLTFLSYLNVSYNRLVGRIPLGSQTQTFSEDSFRGNNGLCGFPLKKICVSPHDESEPKSLNSREVRANKNSDKDIYVSSALGFFVGLGVMFGLSVLSKRWRQCYDKQADRFVSLVFRSRRTNEGW